MSAHNPQLLLFVGPMFSSKTSKLLMELERCKHQRKRVVAFKPALDDRYSASDIVNHLGWRHPATTIRNGAGLLEVLALADLAPDVVAVDEAFMLPGIADVLVWLYRTGVTVAVSTLDISSTGKPFAEVEKLMPWATHIDKCTAVCTVCGGDAAYTHKKQASAVEIEVGGGELYEPRCFSHHIAIDNRAQLTDE